MIDTLSINSSGVVVNTNATITFPNLIVGTASYSNVAATASYFSGQVNNAISASYALSASWAPSTSTASYAATASYLNNTASNAITASYAVTASYLIGASATASYALVAATASFVTASNINGTVGSSTNAVTASYAITASYALNGGGGGSTTISYVTLTPDASNYITCSFNDKKEIVTISTAAAYNFTASNLPTVGEYLNVSLFLKNTAATTSSLFFPANWTWIGLAPVILEASKSAYLNLEAYDTTALIAAWGPQY